MRITSRVIMSAALLQSRDEVQDFSCGPCMLDTSTSFLASRLEQAYAYALEEALGTDGVGDDRPKDFCVHHKDVQVEQACSETDGKATIGRAEEARAVCLLGEKLPGILIATDWAGSSATLWGVDLARDSSSRRSLLAAFLRAREWDVARTEDFLVETLTWRRDQAIDGRSDEASASDGLLGLPDDVIHMTTNSKGQKHMMVVLKLGAIQLEALQAADAFVAWRVRMQERACKQLADAWQHAPRGPTYTLVLDCAGLRPYHFGRASRRALGQLTYTLTHFYPDLVGETIVVHAPGFVSSIWSLISRLTPTWWQLRLLDRRAMALFEQREGIRFAA